MAYTVLKNPGNKYFLYDREINAVTPVSEAVSRTLLSESDPDAKDGIIKQLQQYGFCMDSALKKIEHASCATLDSCLQNQVKDLILQVTQSCNLRCEYCTYSGNYYTRTHSIKKMPAETAFKAVDFMVKHSKEKKVVSIGFYGGEPLLAFDLIKQVIEYIEANYAGKNFKYTITTNGTLLTEEIIDYLVAKDFVLMISLDGPEEVHNRHRKFADGTGSFDKIRQNLTMVKKRHPDYFRQIKTNTVFAPGKNFEAIINFFNEDTIFSGLQPMFSVMSDMDAKGPVALDESFSLLYQKEHFKLLLYMLGELDRKLISEPFFKYLEELGDTYKAGITKIRLPEKSHPSGPCIAGVMKLFVDTDGDLYPCERVGESETAKIGSLETGYDREKVKKLTNVGSLSEEECMDCWAFRHCELCFGKCLDQGKLSKEKKISHCKSIQNNARNKLLDIEFLKEYGLDFEKLSQLYAMKEVQT